jgi:uncharacterized protein YndB with AHSA1/START domain
MSDVSVEREISAPPDKVWSLVSDITRMGEWSPEARDGEWIKGATGPAVGARFKGRNARGKRSWSTDCRVVECDPGSRFAFAVSSGPLSVSTWTYVITPTADGCHVVESWDDTRGAIIRTAGRLVTGVVDRTSHNRDGMVRTLDALATAAE